jgi:hypothetical protein
MVKIDVQTVCHNNTKQADFLISITSPAGAAGIESVVVTAIDKTNIKTQTPQGCPPALQFSVSGVPFDSLPVYVDVTECQSGVDQGQAIKIKTSSGPLGRECLGISDCGPVGQNKDNSACVKLQNDIANRRNQILIQCGDASALKSQRDALLIAAAAFLAASIATATVAASVVAIPIWGQIAATALFITAGVFLAASTALGIWAIAVAIQLSDLQAKMDQERQDLNSQIQRLRDVCCTEFINPANWDIPVCPN